MKIPKVFAAVLFIALIALPLQASDEASIPYIEIERPMDGQTVHDSTELVVVAEGHNLRNPVVSIREEDTGMSYPLTGCVYSSPAEEISQLDSTANGMKMYCRTDINLKSFQDEKVILTVSVTDNDRKLTDSVGLYVSGECL